MHYSDEDFEDVVQCGKVLDVDLLPEDAGGIAYTIYKDFDCKKRMNVLLFYCRPEYRGRYLRYMFRRLEEIAKQEGVAEILIGASDTGYKEDKFNKMLNYFGYNRVASYIKRI